MSLGPLKTERVLACLIQLSKNRLPVWQESNSGFSQSNTADRDVKPEKGAAEGYSQRGLRKEKPRGAKLALPRGVRGTNGSMRDIIREW